MISFLVQYPEMPTQTHSPASFLRAAGLTPFQRLETEEEKRIFATDASLATYLASLKKEEVEEIIAAIRRQAFHMPLDVQTSLIKLLTALQERIERKQAELAHDVTPIATGIATTLRLQEQIETLETLEASLSHS